MSKLCFLRDMNPSFPPNMFHLRHSASRQWKKHEAIIKVKICLGFYVQFKHVFSTSHHSKSCMIRVGTTRTVFVFSRTVQSGLPSAESTQHVLCNKCSLQQDQSASQSSCVPEVRVRHF